jgi:hypothetical protein
MSIIKIQSEWEASERSPAMTELQDGPGQLRVSVTQVIGQCSTLKPVLTDIEGRINTFKQLCSRHQSLPDWIQMMNTSKIQSDKLDHDLVATTSELLQ